MDNKTIVTSEVESNEEGLEQRHSYVLHGAQAICEFATRPGRLTIPVCHGTYMHDMPVMTVEDCKLAENIKVFGYCLCKNNPDIFTEMDKILEEVEKADNLLDKIMDGPKNLFSKVKSIFGVKEKKKTLDDYGSNLVESVHVLCSPTFAVNDTWSGGSDRMMINGVPALNSGCTMVCTKCGGKISIIDDGQANAINVQKIKEGVANGISELKDRFSI